MAKKKTVDVRDQFKNETPLETTLTLEEVKEIKRTVEPIKI